MVSIRITTAAVGSAAFLLTHQAAAAQEVQTASLDTQDLSELTIEQLAQLPVRSASKREEPLSAAPT